MMRLLVLPIAALALAVPLPPPATAAEAPAFVFPVDCDYGRDCFIQNYVDHDPGSGRTDYACGRLSYDGHDGTDIRLPGIADIADGVAVLAAADGTVLRVRDGMIDRSIDDQPDGAVTGREAGNGVIVDHGNGWQTQYSHLRQGSVVVAPGDRVVAGQPLGEIGLSGLTEFPHVEFTVRFEGVPLDPFVGQLDPAGGFACGSARQPLWAAADGERLAYIATAALIAGFADGRPDRAVAESGGYDSRVWSTDAPALVFWVHVMGALAGDRQRFAITGPDGATVHETETVLETSYVSWFAFSGARPPDDGWPGGPYRGTYALLRDGQTVAEITRLIEVR